MWKSWLFCWMFCNFLISSFFCLSSWSVTESFTFSNALSSFETTISTKKLTTVFLLWQKFYLNFQSFFGFSPKMSTICNFSTKFLLFFFKIRCQLEKVYKIYLFTFFINFNGFWHFKVPKPFNWNLFFKKKVKLLIFQDGL